MMSAARVGARTRKSSPKLEGCQSLHSSCLCLRRIGGLAWHLPRLRLAQAQAVSEKEGWAVP